MKTLSLSLMVLLYVGAGVTHFLRPKMYLSIMPPWSPIPQFLILASGICEILFGLLLIPSQTRTLGAWLIIALLIAMFPATVQMAMQYTKLHRTGWWLTWLRLPLQAVLIWWAYSFTSYPFLLIN